MVINVHAGHNPDGKIACGACGLIKESTEARKVKKEVIKLLRAKGHTVYDCTCANGKSQTDVLKQIVTKWIWISPSNLIVELEIRKGMARLQEQRCMYTVPKALLIRWQRELTRRLQLSASGTVGLRYAQICMCCIGQTPRHF